MKKIKLSFLLALGFFLSLSAAPLDETKTAFFDSDLQWAFPQKLGGLDYVMVEKYDEKEQGYKVFYKEGDAFKVEITIYNMGHATIPDGCKDPMHVERFKGVEYQLKRREKQGQILELKKRGTIFFPPKSTLQFVSTAFQYKLNKNPEDQKSVIKIVYVTAQKNNFVKVVFLCDFAQRVEAQKRSGKMISQLIKMLQTKHDEKTSFLAFYESLLCDPTSYSGKIAAQYILDKVKKAKDLNTYTHLFVWTKMSTPPKNYELLLAGYFAGMFKGMMDEKGENAGDLQAFCTMLDVYKTMRKKDEIVEMPKLDEWAAVSDKKALFEKLLFVEK